MAIKQKGQNFVKSVKTKHSGTERERDSDLKIISLGLFCMVDRLSCSDVLIGNTEVLSSYSSNKTHFERPINSLNLTTMN